MNTSIATLIAIAYLFLIPVRVLAQDSVQLRPTCRVQSVATLTLGDVAELKGSQASKLGAIALTARTEPGQKELVVGIQDVRSAIDAHARGLGVNVGGIAINGSSCRVYQGVAVVAPQALPVAQTQAAQTAQMVAAASGPMTIRAMVLQKVIESAALPASDIRVSFDARNAALLDKSTSGRTVTVNATGTGEKLGYAVRVYEQNMLVSQDDVRVGVLVRRDVAVATRSLGRGEAIDASDFTKQEEWLPLTRRPADVNAVAGSMVKGRVNPGEVIDARMIEDPLAVKAGDRISVDCIAGNLVVRTLAIAKTAGKRGDVITAETIEWKQGILVKISDSGHGVSMGPVDTKKNKTAARANRS